MFDAYVRTLEFAYIGSIAEAIRQELGEEIEAHPGHRDPAEAGQVNRAYRAAARRLLLAIAPPSEDLRRLLTWALTQVARLRLIAGGLDDDQVERLLAMEPGGRDDWLAFLILASWPQVEHLLDEQDAD